MEQGSRIPLPTLAEEPGSYERLLELYIRRDAISNEARSIVTMSNGPIDRSIVEDIQKSFANIADFVDSLSEFMVLEGKKIAAGTLQNQFGKYFRNSSKQGAWENFLQGLGQILTNNGLISKDQSKKEEEEERWEIRANEEYRKRCYDEGEGSCVINESIKDEGSICFW